MNHDPADDRRLAEGFRDQLRMAQAEAPSFDDLAAYAEGRLSAEERSAFEERLADDPALRQEMDDLRVLHAQMAQRPRVVALPRRRPWVLAGLAAAAALAAVSFWMQRAPEPAHAPGSALGGGGGPQRSPAPSSLAALSDGGARVALSTDGTVSGLPVLEPALQAAVADALRGGLPTPSGLAPLQTGRSTLMGDTAGAPPFMPLAPLATRVATSQPLLRWTPHPEARAYEVAVFDQDLQKQAESGPLTGTQWQVPRGLAAGHIYLWQVSAETRHGRVTVPAPPEPEARFEVAAPALLTGVEQRRAAAPRSHLVAAVVLVEAGLLDDAEVELRGLAAENPGSAEAVKLQRRLRELRAPTGQAPAVRK